MKTTFCILSIVFIVISCNSNTITLVNKKCEFEGSSNRYNCNEYFSNGQLATEYSYKLESNEKVLEGEFKAYYPNGNPKRTALYYNGTIVSDELLFFENGNIQYKKYYSSSGDLHGNHYECYKNGKIKSYSWHFDKYVGIIRDYTKNGEIIRSRGFIPSPLITLNKDKFTINDTIHCMVHFPMLPYSDTKFYYWEAKENNWKITNDTVFIYSRISNVAGKYIFKVKVEINESKVKIYENPIGAIDIDSLIQVKISEVDFEVIE